MFLKFQNNKGRLQNKGIYLKQMQLQVNHKKHILILILTRNCCFTCIEFVNLYFHIFMLCQFSRRKHAQDHIGNISGFIMIAIHSKSNIVQILLEAPSATVKLLRWLDASLKLSISFPSCNWLNFKICPKL